MSEPLDEWLRRALAHRITNGAGAHEDRRTRRKRTRGDRNRWEKYDQEENQ